MISLYSEGGGFKSKIREHVLKVQMSDLTYKFVKEMSEQDCIEGKKPWRLYWATQDVKKMSKIHQLFSGTVKLETERSGNDLSKARVYTHGI